jgi:hypothetical protein
VLKIADGLNEHCVASICSVQDHYTIPDCLDLSLALFVRHSSCCPLSITLLLGHVHRGHESEELHNPISPQLTIVPPRQTNNPFLNDHNILHKFENIANNCTIANNVASTTINPKET